MLTHAAWRASTILCAISAALSAFGIVQRSTIVSVNRYLPGGRRPTCLTVPVAKRILSTFHVGRAKVRRHLGWLGRAHPGRREALHGNARGRKRRRRDR